MLRYRRAVAESIDGHRSGRLLGKNSQVRFDWNQTGWEFDRSSLASARLQAGLMFIAAVHRWYLAKNASAA